MFIVKIYSKTRLRRLPYLVFKRTKALDYSPNAKLKTGVTDKYSCLPIPECKCLVNYVWIDGTGDHMRSKTKTFDYSPSSHKEIPTWTVDGSATRMTGKKNSDIFICPVAMYNDPTRKGNSKLVLCDTYYHDHKPTKTNFRHACLKVLNSVCDQHPQFGLEQEYHFLDADERPLGWPRMLGEPAPSGHYYCGVGGNRAYGRDIAESHYKACLYAGIKIYGINAEANLSQWEFRVGVTEGIKAADDLWMARYLLYKIAEEYGVAACLHPRLFPNWKGATCHTNFSTKAMRESNGLKAIEKAICKLEKKHERHMQAYGNRVEGHNTDHLGGVDGIPDPVNFSYGVADRIFSVRIPRIVNEKKKGWLEDCRPASNCDPYRVMGCLIKTCLIE